jgi:glycosyltransferase involved in cell wall biosynthesis
MPAHNEEQNIVQAMDAATKMAERLFADHEIIVVDDGSTDRTAAIVNERIAIDPRVRMLRHPGNRGYGEALRTGFRAASKDLVFFTDSDNQFDVEELEAFLPWIGSVDVVAGFRWNRQDRRSRVLIGKAWNALVRVLFYVPVRDIDCAFKLFRRSVFERLDLEAVGAMVNTELMVLIGRNGFGVREIGVTHRPRLAGQPRGANPRVILMAFRELFALYRKLKSAAYQVAPPPAA